MALITTKKLEPSIFNEIIRTRISKYIEKEVNELIKKKTNQIITEVLSNLQTESNMYADMMAFEQRLVVKAIYNGEEIVQKPTPTKAE